MAEAEARAARVEAVLASDAWSGLLAATLSGAPGEHAEAVETIAALTRLRMVDGSGSPRDDYAGPPESAPDGYVPWFDAPGRRWVGPTIVCGHWAALGRRLRPGLIALDSGCVWGNSLTAVRLEDAAIFEQPCAG